MDAPQADQPSASREVRALLAVIHAVHDGTELRSILDTIAAEATGVVDAMSSSVLMVDRPGQFRLAGSYQLTAGYESFLSSRFIVEGHGAAGRAFESGRVWTADDMDRDALPTQPASAGWRRFARIEGYRSMASVPLTFKDERLGVLNVYRAAVGSWTDNQVDLLTAFGQHAAGAIATAQLLDTRARDVAALTRVVGVLRQQTHEYANRLHAIQGLLALGAYDAAAEFVDDLMAVHHEAHTSTLGRIEHPLIAAIVLAMMNLARQRGIELVLDPRSAFESLPPRLRAADAVTILGNLLDNAIDAVASMPAERRRVVLDIRDIPDGMTISVRDFGAGLPATQHDRLFEQGFSAKRGHAGVGLSLVSDAVAASQGTIAVERQHQGTRFDIFVPA